MLKNLAFWMLFKLIIHQFFAQYQNKMNSKKANAKAYGVEVP